MAATRPVGSGQNSGSGFGDATKTLLTNHPLSAAIQKTNADTTGPSNVDSEPLVAAVPHYLAQGNNWLLWLLVLLIALFLLALEIRRRIDAKAKRKARLGG
jgi:hypothetical protein